jgi:hypothetical protein
MHELYQKYTCLPKLSIAEQCSVILFNWYLVASIFVIIIIITVIIIIKNSSYKLFIPVHVSLNMLVMFLDTSLQLLLFTVLLSLYEG